ncbi:MAG: hypothetical protein HQL08_05965 [Nitrospirae bacterium]|nr:hypothetical protein [Nitrospirota bacterium]
MKLFLIAICLLWPLTTFAAEQVVTLDTRPGVTMNLLVSNPEMPSHTALLMFPGADGYNQFSIEKGEIRRGRNFLVRTVPDFTKRGFIVAVIDTPSDRSQGMDDTFRTSKDHLQDIMKAVEYLSAKGCTSIYLVGTSRGTISVAYLGAELKHDGIKGIVLTSTMKYSKFLRWLSIEKISYPVLIVHNSDDECKSTPYDEAGRLAQKFKSSPKATFEGVSGGLPPQSDSCLSLSAHGFFGIEDRVVKIISDWASH